MERYQKIEKPGKLLGEGTYGQVYKAKDLHTGAIVARTPAEARRKDEREQAAQSGEGRHSEEWDFAFSGSASH